MPTKTRTSRTRSRSRSLSLNKHSKFIQSCFGLLNTIKLYHWNTHAFAEHKATDEFYETMQDLVDKYAETLLGTGQSRFSMPKKEICITLTYCTSHGEIVRVVQEFKRVVSNVATSNTNNAELINITDDMLISIDKLLYFFTLH